MMNKKFIYTLVGIISFLSFYFSVFAEEIEVSNYGNYYQLFGDVSSKFQLNENTYSQFKEFFNNYINENLDSNETYLVSLNVSRNRFIMSNIPLTYDYIYTTNTATFFPPGKVEKWLEFNFSFSEDKNNLNIDSGILNSYGTNDLMTFISRNFSQYASNPIIWSNKPLKYNLSIDESKTYYKHVYTVVPDYLKKCNYDSVGIYGVNYPIYTYTNLLFCDYDYKEPEPEKVNYKVEYYFDDILSSEKTEFKSGYENDLVTDFIDYSSDLYKLYIENQDYKLTLTKNESNNVLRIYYRSPLYGTLKQPIDTSNSNIYLFFQFSDIKAMFPNVRFENFTQFEQLVVVGLFNLLYGVFLLICIYIILKASFKCWSWIMEFVK